MFVHTEFQAVRFVVWEGVPIPLDRHIRTRTAVREEAPNETAKNRLLNFLRKYACVIKPLFLEENFQPPDICKNSFKYISDPPQPNIPLAQPSTVL